MKPLSLKGARSAFVWSLVALSAFALALSLVRYGVTGTSRYMFLSWNLLLAWTPLGLAWLLYIRTPKGLVWSWTNFWLFAAWLLFLPNAFYLLSDFIHLRRLTEIGIMFDVVLFSAYASVGVILGFTSLFLVHVRAVQRFGVRGHWLPAVALLLSGFAIYLGRYLRWNSWDIIFNPFGLLFDVTNSVINPGDHTQTFTTTLLFFGLVGLQYVIIWFAIRLVLASQQNKK